MRWDIFCKVIDNFGDIGVCWRLARQLAARQQGVRLWLDDRRALPWMAPEVMPDGSGHHGIEVRHWPDTGAPLPQDCQAGDVVIEAFGCDLPEAFIALMQRPNPPHWINLEYFSAEDYVERSHGLRSPVFSGPGAGLSKHFFYPGMTRRTGGLLRAPSLSSTAAWRAQAFQAMGVNWVEGQRAISLFCYQDSPVEMLLSQLSLSQQQLAQAHPSEPDWLILLTSGPATEQALRASGQGVALPGLQLHTLPALPQPRFDTLLACCDLNFVRGEDSAVQALWPARPHVWQIYRQDDGVHADKLHAFMDRWMAAWPSPLRDEVTRLWVQWNALPWLNNAPNPTPDLSALAHLLAPPLWSQWQQASAQSCAELQQQDDLVTQLLAFVTRAG